MEEKKLGKIQSIKLGQGGYDDAMFGVSVALSMDGYGVQDFKGWWVYRSNGAKWSEEDGNRYHLDTYTWLKNLMRDAKVQEFNELAGTPVEVVIEDGLLKSWRVLTEVL